MRPLITLITDFGTADGYVAEIKGVLASGAPDATILDLTHEIPPQDIDAARLVVARSWRGFPERTVHMVVVDPGVGGARDAIAVQSQGQFLVGPDNGVLSPALLSNDAEAVALPVPREASPTFHGRDVFAPTAARLACRPALSALGPVKADCVLRRTPPTTRRADGAIQGEVIIIDRFGNLITNIMTRTHGKLSLSGCEATVLRTYSDVGEGVLVALTGSSGFLEVAVRNGDAASLLGAKRGAPVVWTPQ